MSDSNFEIWPSYEVFYIHGMLFDTQSAVKSIELVSSALHQLSESTSGDSLADFDSEGILNNLQNIVVQGAALSRYFWPVRKGHEHRGQKLREALGVLEDSPLKVRDLRNEIEHLDEKLDRCLSGGIVGYIFPHYVGPVLRSDGVPSHIFRAYYVDVGLFEILGKRYEIEPIANEIFRIHENLIRCGRNGGRLRRQPDNQLSQRTFKSYAFAVR
jgi:hypothetical protein